MCNKIHIFMLLFLVSVQMKRLLWLFWSNICLYSLFSQKVQSGWAGCIVTPRRSLVYTWYHNRSHAYGCLYVTKSHLVHIENVDLCNIIQILSPWQKYKDHYVLFVRFWVIERNKENTYCSFRQFFDIWNKTNWAILPSKLIKMAQIRLHFRLSNN